MLWFMLWNFRFFCHSVDERWKDWNKSFINMITFTKLVWWGLEYSCMWGSFYSRERILEDTPLHIFCPMWRWSKICELQKEREKKDCTGVPNWADSSIVADVFPSSIIKLQRPNRQWLSFPRWQHTHGEGMTSSGDWASVNRKCFLNIRQEIGQACLDRSCRHIEGTGKLTINQLSKLVWAPVLQSVCACCLFSAAASHIY